MSAYSTIEITGIEEEVQIIDNVDEEITLNGKKYKLVK